eukprot:4690288-Alexandrium_andersonii.AAC.1
MPAAKSGSPCSWAGGGRQKTRASVSTRLAAAWPSKRPGSPSKGPSAGEAQGLGVEHGVQEPASEREKNGTVSWSGRQAGASRGCSATPLAKRTE